MEKAYSAIKVTKEGYRIYGPGERPVQNHRKKDLPIFTEGVASNFCRDLNEIYLKNKDVGIVKSEVKGPSYALLKTEVPERELTESFSYCFLSTMMEAEESDFTFEVEAAIMKGFLCNYFLTTPSMEDSEIARPLILYFDQAGIDFRKNFSSNKERSHTTLQIAQHFECLFKDMEPYQRLMVQLLYHFFDNFSIVLPMLWVMGRINEAEVVRAYWIFYLDQNQELNQVNENPPTELYNFLKLRLHYLKLTSYFFATKKKFKAL